MTRRFSLLIAAVLLPILLATMLFATSGTQAAAHADICATCTYATIQEAVSTHIPEGDTLTLAAETFTENVEITR
ncbi:hypothetical protein MNBD_CHLOROFLEXI01-5089, partial [hydrothermal vent metagenome]